MTLPDERYRAVVQTQKFLIELLNTPRIPRNIKDGARSMLRHYPSEWDMKQAALAAPEIFSERMEPLYRIIRQYEEEQNNGNA